MWQLAGVTLPSRLLLGTAQYPSPQHMLDAVRESGAGVVTVSLRRQAPGSGGGERFWQMVKGLGVRVLPNTAGCRSASEAITIAQMARELFETTWIKLEVIGDDYNLQPDPFGTVEAARHLVSAGFEVFPYCTDDLVFCRRLLDAGCRVLMPWGAPIGTGQGLLNPYQARVLRERLPEQTLILDAGVGRPSHAVQAMELGYDGVLLNTAVSQAREPVIMAVAFARAVESGRLAFESGLMPPRDLARPSTPVPGTPFWHHQA